MCLESGDSLVELVARLDQAFRSWADGLSHAEIAALRYFQGIGYEGINRLLRGQDDPEELPETRLEMLDQRIDALDTAIEKGRVPFALVAFRGIRTFAAEFAATEPSVLVGRTFRLRSYLSTTLDRRVAEEVFTDPSEGAILELTVAQDQTAAWLRIVGHASIEDECELLLPRGTRFRVTSVDEGAGALIIRGEVQM